MAKQGWRIAGHSAIVVIFGFLFLIAISAVFFGFIGYYSRVSLSNELRQNKDGSSVDVLFMSVDQITKDELALAILRKEKNALEAEATKQLDEKSMKFPHVARI